jgi:hypothetical protein
MRFSPVFLRAFAPLSLLLGSLFLASPVAAQPANYLIKGSGDTVYYHSIQGKRYFFPSESVFKTWYPDFTNVAKITDAELANIPLAGNVTYRPGSTLVKITTDPKVYALSRYGTLHWVKTEVVAAALFGLNWNTKVVDVPDTYFSNYIIGFPIDAPNQYSRNEALATAISPDENIRPVGYLPESTAPVAPGTIENHPIAEVSLSASQVVMNQTVNVEADVTGSILPIEKIVIRAEGVTTPYATCLNTTECFAQFLVQTAPLNLRFYAEATDNAGVTHTTPDSLRPSVMAMSASDQIQVSASPLTANAGDRVSFTSNASEVQSIASHKVYILIQGEPTPVLWKDCGTSTTCSASTPFYRTTSIYGQVLALGQTQVSAPVRIAIMGVAPKPTMTVKSKVGNVSHLSIVAPFGETIGKTVIVEGTNLVEDPAIAMCEGSCEISVQVTSAASYTAFTWVGGKAEPSETLTLTP